MIVKSFQTGVLACTLLVAGFDMVRAEPEGAAGVEGSGKTDVPDKSEGTPARTPQTMLSEAKVTLDRLEASADNIGRMLRVARDDKDVVKVVCLDDKLSQMNVAARSAADRVGSLQAAVDSGNVERAEHDDAVLGALALRATDLSEEANQCIGEEQGALGDTLLQVWVDPAIPTSNTSDPVMTVIISAPPVAASPTL